MPSTKKFLSIKTTLSVFVAVSIGIIVLILTTYNTLNIRKDSFEKETERAKALAKNYATWLKAELEVPLDMARSLAYAFSSLKSNEKSAILSRDTANAMLKRILQLSPQFLGIWTCWEPNAFDGKDSQFAQTVGHDKTGRFIPYWTRNKSGDVNVEAITDYETGAYYVLPKKLKQEIVLDPYIYFIQNYGKEVLMCSLIVPVIVNDVFYGVVGVDVTCDSLQQSITSEKIYEGRATIAVLSHNGTYVLHSKKPDLLGKNTNETTKLDLTELTAGKEAIKIHADSLEIIVPTWFGGSSQAWQVRLSIPQEVLYEKSKKEMWFGIGTGFFLLILAIGFMFFFLEKLVRPIIRLGKIAESMGQNSVNMKASQVEVGMIAAVRKDEIGILAKAFHDMLENLLLFFENSNIISGNLEKASNSLLAMTTQQSASAEELSASVNKITTSVQEMNASAKQVEKRSIHVSEFSHNCKGISKESLSIVDQNLKEMNHIKEQVTEIANRIMKLTEESQKIDNITAAIKDIANQTNMLALNAAIEAARAGEFGKGFAVVASQIRELAQKCAGASREIADLIKQIQSSIHSTVMVTEQGAKSVDEGVDMVKKTSEGFEKLTVAVEQMEERAQEIRLGATEQTTATEQMVLGMVSINDVLKQNVEATKQSRDMVESLHEMAQKLMGSVEKFR